MAIIFICSGSLNCLRSVCTIVITTKKRKAKPVSKQSPLRKFSLKAAIFCCFDVCHVKPPQKFQVQAKISTIRSVFPDIFPFLMTMVSFTDVFFFWYLLKLLLFRISQGYSFLIYIKKNRSSHPYMFLGKGVLKICSTFTGQHPCLSAISIKLLKICSKFTGEHQCRSAIAIKLLATLLKSYFDMGFLL